MKKKINKMQSLQKWKDEKKETLNKIKKLYRYYLECKNDNTIARKDKEKQSVIIKQLLWNIGIPTEVMSKKDFGKKFLQGEYDLFVKVSFMNHWSQFIKQFDSDETKKQQYSGFATKKRKSQIECLKSFQKSCEEYKNGVLPYQDFLLVFQEYFGAMIDVYNLKKLEVEAITNTTLARTKEKDK